MDIVPMPKRKARILVVEDGITMRMFYRQVLEDAGFEVEEAVNGAGRRRTRHGRIVRSAGGGRQHAEDGRL